MNKPTPFGKYYLLDRIAVGGMAEVFKAKAVGVEGFERFLAVKRILPNIAEDEEFITMFIDEAKIAVQLQHANIAQIFDLGKVDDSFFIALEYVHGKDLRSIFDHGRKSDETLPVPQACFVVMQICEGLDYAHNKRDAQGRELNLVHRDVSPQNVLIGYDGEVKLVDFGIAKAAGKASKTQAGILKGKFGYMSPEQVRGLPVDRRSDIFSMGIVIYELLTGERLFAGESDFSTLEKVRNVDILPPSSFNKKVPTELERIVLKALARSVEDRYQNAIDLHDDLQAFLYSVGEFYSRKDLSAWMKATFSAELAEANAKLEEYEQMDRFDEPTPAPRRGVPGLTPVRQAASPGSGSPKDQKNLARGGGKGAGASGAAGGLEWDDEELETQIFDKAPDEKDDELSSGDIMLQEHELGDDKTVATSPSPELLAEAEAAAGQQQRPALAVLPRRTPMGGPPPGLAAFRPPTPATGMDGFPAGARPQHAQRGPHAQHGQHAPYAQHGQHQQHQIDGAPPRTAFEPPRTTFRETLTGMPPASYAHQPSAVPERRPLEHFARRSSRLPSVIAAMLALTALGYGGYRYVSRPGKLQVLVKPADAQITVDGTALKGMPPVTIEKAPGAYHLSVTREGYIPRDQNVEIRAGQFERQEIELEPSPDTGFELTSEPAGGLVWLDGHPFSDNAQQARTNFRAYRVAPGKHVIEIKGDPRFEDWKHEFVQNPGKTEKIHAERRPVAAAGAVKPTPAVVPQPPKPAPKPAPRPIAVARLAPRPQPRRVVKKVDEDVFEKETKLGAGGADGGECSVSLGSKPWSEVWIDGKKVGPTPLVDHKLPCGKHKISFKNPELNIERKESVTVRAGEKLKKVVALVDGEE